MLRWLWLCFFPGLVFADCTVTDASGHILHFPHPAQRIISLAPDITENLFAAGAGKAVVGVLRGSDYPKEVTNLPVVGSYRGLDVERIMKLKPDLVVAWQGNFIHELQQLQKLHIAIYITNPKHLADIPKTIMQFGCLAGTQSFATQSANAFNAALEKIKPVNQSKKTPVFYQLGSYNLITINRDSWINEAIDFCGGKNIFANAKFTAPEISWEAAIKANPDVILSSSVEKNWRTHWQRYPQITAVKKHALYNLHDDWIERAGPRLVLGVQEVCGYLRTM